MNRALSAALAVLAPLVTACVLSPEAAAAPAGTATITGSARACSGPQAVSPKGSPVRDPRDVFYELRCAVHLNERWLRESGHADAVAEAVWTSPGSVGVTQGSTGPCVYAELPSVLGFNLRTTGPHYCNEIIFFGPSDAGLAYGGLAPNLIPDRDAAVLVLLHENAHRIQQLAGLDMAKLNGNDARYAFRLENSADCWAGAGAREMTDSAVYRIDPRRGAGLLASMANAMDAPGTGHGSARDRADGFLRGWKGGAPACDRIYGRRIYS